MIVIYLLIENASKAVQKRQNFKIKSKQNYMLFSTKYYTSHFIAYQLICTVKYGQSW